MTSTEESRQWTRSGAMAIVGFAVGFVSYTASMVIVMSSVPRLAEGARQTVNLPWPAYVSLPTTLALLPLIISGLAIPVRKWNLAFIAGVNLAIAFCASSSSELLRRDYIGKF